MRKLLVVMFLTGCTAPAVSPPVTQTSQVYRPYVTWDVTSPFVDFGSSESGAGSDLWSVSPDGGPIFDLTFHHGRLSMRFESPRNFFEIGVSTDISRSGALFVLPADSSTLACTSWTGVFEVSSDIPNWNIRIDAGCETDRNLRVTGTWFGYPEGS